MEGGGGVLGGDVLVTSGDGLVGNGRGGGRAAPKSAAACAQATARLMPRVSQCFVML